MRVETQGGRDAVLPARRNRVTLPKYTLQDCGVSAVQVLGLSGTETGGG